MLKFYYNLGSLTYGTCIKTNHINSFLMQLYASRNIHFLYIITFLHSLLEGLQKLPTLKQIVSLNIGLKFVISYYGQGHIIQDLCTLVYTLYIDFKNAICSIDRLHLKNSWYSSDVLSLFGNIYNKASPTCTHTKGSHPRWYPKR